MDESGRREYSLHELPDEELAALLAEAPPEDEFTAALLDEYDRRAETSLPEAERMKAECLQALREAEPPRGKRRVLRFAAAAAAAVLILAGAVLAFGSGRWAVNRDEFFFRFQKDETEAQMLTEPAVESDDLAELMASAGVPDGMVPTWLPDGYIAEKPEAEVYGSLAMFQQGFVNGDERIEYRYFTSTSPNGLWYPNDSEPELYYAGGEAHYILPDKGPTGNVYYSAVWQREGFECSISGYSNREELVRAIDSIYD